MESNEKKISMHPDLMFMTSGKTQKRKSTPNKTDQIKIKTPPKTKINTLRKQSLLKMIRKHQDEKHRQQLQMISPSRTHNPEKIHNSAMSDTLQFMNNVKEKHSTNQTLKNNNYNTITISNDNQEPRQMDETTTSEQSITHIHENRELQSQDNSIHFNVNVPQNHIQPTYGCLKDGTLPTYKSLHHNKNSGTRKHLLQPIDNNDKQNNSIRQHAELSALQKYTSHKQKSSNKQRKIIRRTFNVGKHNKDRKISVLISNKKIRSNTTIKLQQLKEVPIYQVKKDLIKRGLIKVGCVTPESVLRQMYLMTHSMCGSIYNHNADLLLHNYLNNE